MFEQRPRPLTPALSPKGRGSNTGRQPHRLLRSRACHHVRKRLAKKKVG